MGIPCGYERSFKLQNKQILANRYLLGIETKHLSEQQWQQIFRQLNMPGNFISEFRAGLADANTVLLGFEAQADGIAVFKLYLEYWEQLNKQRQTDAGYKNRHLLHLGFKWQADAPHHQQITHYHCLPGLSTKQIKLKISDLYSPQTSPAGLTPALSILDLAEHTQPQAEYLYLEVSEAGSQRQAYDLNLYPAGLTISDIMQPIELAAKQLKVDPLQFQKLVPLIENKLFGHISAGTGRDGQRYFTVYYEN